MINAKLQNIIDTKAAIGNAINNKGGTITSATPFYEYAPAIENLASGGATAYSTWVIQDENGAKYVPYNGYDAAANPTPNLSNMPFGFILNNSASETPVLNNTVMTISSNAPFQNNSAGINVAFMPFVGQAFYNGLILSLIVNNGNIFVGGQRGQNAIASVITKYNEDNLVAVANSNVYGAQIYNLAINNGFIYAGGSGNSTSGRDIKRYYESNLTFLDNSVSYGSIIRTMAINNGYIYVGGDALSGVNRGVSKFYESNLALVGNTVNFGGDIYSIAINNGFVYVAGIVNTTVKKFYEDNLAFVGNTASYGGSIYSIITNNGFIYVGGSNNRIQRFFEGNLARPATNNQSGLYGNWIETLSINNGFIYAGGRPRFSANRGISKFYENNLALVANTPQNYDRSIVTTAINNGYFYLGGYSAGTLLGDPITNYSFDKHLEQTDNLVDTPIYSINRVKE
jgi:hypothetical protein